MEKLQTAVIARKDFQKDFRQTIFQILGLGSLSGKVRRFARDVMEKGRKPFKKRFPGPWLPFQATLDQLSLLR